MKLNFKDKKKKLIEKFQPSEVLLDSLSQKKEGDFFENKIETPLSKSNIFWFFFFILVIIFLLLVKSFQLQVLEKDKFLALAQKNKFIFQKIKSQRGIIYDQNFEPLVLNKVSFNLILDKKFLPKNEKERMKIFEEVAKILKKNPDILKKEIENTKEEKIKIAQNLDHQTLLLLETKISKLPGFEIEKTIQREYIKGEIFSHIIGYQTKSKIKAGLEKVYDEILSEKLGKMKVERDVKGKVLSKKIVSLPQPGKNLWLWIDGKLQEKVYQEMKRVMEKTNVKIASAILLDVKTGGVLSLVSFPSYDNNLFSKGITKEQWQILKNDPYRPLFNYSIKGEFLPASTIKPFLALAALQEKIIDPKKKIYCPGFISIPNPWNPKSPTIIKDWKVHHWTDLKKAIAQSCNVYFFAIGGGYKDQKGLGPLKIKKYLEIFGWGKKTGIDLLGEAKGFLPDPQWKETKLGQKWTLGDTYLYAIGHEFVKVTPLQLAVSFSALVNGGKLFRPKIVRGILDEKKNIIEEKKPELIEDLVKSGKIKKENLKIVKEAMREAVVSGSCTNWLDKLPVKAGCKTGTAQTGEKGIYDGWLVVFAPYEDPQVVLVIFLHKINKNPHRFVLEIAKSILEWYFKNER